MAGNRWYKLKHERVWSVRQELQGGFTKSGRRKSIANLARHLAQAQVLVGGLLVVYNNLINLVPQPVHDRLFIALNLSIAVLLVLWARRRGFAWRELGLSLDRPILALSWGVALGLLLPAPIFLALVLPEPVGSLAASRDWGQLSMSALAYQTLLRIPLGTALFEELAFRGVLHAVWSRAAGERRAVIGGSVAFGLWHVTPTIELLGGSGLFHTPVLLGLGVLGGVIAASVGGLFFSFVRLRTGSVYAPFLTHWLINAVGAVAAFLVAR